MGSQTTETWTRPENVPYPSVWARFEGKAINGVIPKFWIQDTPEEEFDNVVKIMFNRFAADEPICSSSKIIEDEHSVHYLREVGKHILEQKVSICCFMENPNDNQKPILAGVNCTYITSSDHKANLDQNIVGKNAYSMLYTVDYVQNVMKNPFEELKIDHLLTAMGLYVFPEFRGQTLGTKIIQAREPLCKAIGIPACVNIFSSPISQKLAARCGYQVFSEMTYADIMKMNPEVRLYDIEKKSVHCKCMYKIF